MKKTWKVLLSAGLFTASTALASCTTKKGETIDSTKTQVRVFCYNGGFGSDWVKTIANKYEELHKEDSYEEGKKGVQVWIEAKKETNAAHIDKIQNEKYDIYFQEGVNYDAMFTANNGENVMMDITNIVKNPNPYSTFEKDGVAKSIESKMDEESKAYFNTKGGYYALPHYVGACGMIYNKDLFDEKGFYFIRKANGDKFAPDATQEYKDIQGYFEGKYEGSEYILSYGPDGKTGVIDGIDYSVDDGLPSTYEEYFRLCKYIKECNCLPVIWQGYSANDYTTRLLNNLVAAQEVDQWDLNFNFTGTATDLVVLDEGGVRLDSEGKPVLESKTIKMEGAGDKLCVADMTRQVGKYYGLNFIQTLVKNYYDTSRNGNKGFTQDLAQQEFLFSRDENRGQVAMLIDGPWWINEAKSSFESMAAGAGSKYSLVNSKFGWMPMPYAEESSVGTKQSTYVDSLSAAAFINKNVESKPEAVKGLVLDFFQFCHTDWALATYTASTNSVRGFSYDLDILSVGEKSNVSYFCNNLMNYVQKSKICHTWANTEFFRNNNGVLAAEKRYIYSTKGSETYPEDVFYANKGNASFTASTYMKGMYGYYSDTNGFLKNLVF